MISRFASTTGGRRFSAAQANSRRCLSARPTSGPRAPLPPMPRVGPSTAASTTASASVPRAPLPPMPRVGPSVTASTASGPRAPLPSMPRVGPSITGTASATATATPIPTSRLRQWWDNGNLLIGFGWTLFGVLLLDRYLQYSEGMNVESVVGIVEEEARQKRFELLEKHRNDPTLFKCAVRKIYKMGGSHSLMHVELNDVIEVLQEGVGPDQVYNLCRKMNTLDTGVNGQQQQQQVLSIGWYPIQYLEKVREPKKSRWAFWK